MLDNDFFIFEKNEKSFEKYIRLKKMGHFIDRTHFIILIESKKTKAKFPDPVVYFWRNMNFFKSPKDNELFHIGFFQNYSNLSIEMSSNPKRSFCFIFSDRKGNSLL